MEERESRGHAAVRHVVDLGFLGPVRLLGEELGQPGPHLLLVLGAGVVIVPQLGADDVNPAQITPEKYYTSRSRML